jgi:alkanesulfonate monooxygenase SsuD/methylene tetrahydromethanopterin reductase-like flavin-dependent oxidoreductase (luciferase family)
MTDYGHDLLFGNFIRPAAAGPGQVIALAQLSERAGLDLVTVQDGGHRLTPDEAVGALGEAIGIIRQVWDTGQRGGVLVNGARYRVTGAKRGPSPAHDIGIWAGAYKPRMLRLIGGSADGWLPSLSYLPGGVARLPDLNAMSPLVVL